MKVKDIKKLLDAQIEDKTPPLDDKVLRAPINAHGDISHSSGDNNTVNFPRRRYGAAAWVSAVACIAVVVVLVSVLGAYFTRQKKMDGTVDKSQTVCYIVDINPSIVVTADAKGKVIALSSGNSDGDVVLSADELAKCKGRDAEECIEKILEQAAKLGYIDCNSRDNKVTLNVVGGEVDSTTEKLADGLQDYLRRLNVYAYVDTAAVSVKEFAQSRGWEYAGENLDKYMSDIQREGRFVLGEAKGFIGDFQNEVESYIENYCRGLKAKKEILESLGEKLDVLSDTCDVNYWVYKAVEDTLLAPSLSSQAKALIDECDRLTAQLKNLGIEISNTVEFTYYLSKYAIIDSLYEFVDNVSEYIYNSEFFGLFNSIIEESDKDKFSLLESNIRKYYDEVVSVLAEQFDRRTADYADIFDGRAEISDKDYADFLASVR